MTEHLNNTQFQKTAYWLLMLTIFLSYWLFSSQYTGPAYLSDEIGYLTKAAAFAGYPVDMASSWHGGYSLMLSPLFMVFSDPFALWQGIMVFNAAIWTLSFMLLFALLKEFFPLRDFWDIYFAVIISAVYPAWATMSGYVFSTTGFVFVFMLSIFTLLKCSTNNTWSIIPYSLLVGFLYWIHPTGLAVAIASVLAISAYARHYHHYSVLICHVIVTMTMIAVYKMGVHEWLSQFMTPENYPALTHYQSLSSTLQSFFHIKFWMAWGVLIFCQISYLLTATLGISFFAIVESWKRVMPARMGSSIETSALVNTSLAFIVLSILGIVLLGSLFFATSALTSSLSINHWIYGRYSEVALLPLIGIGLLAQWRFKYATAASFIVLVSGLILHLYTNESNTRLTNNLVNIQGFWPQAIFPHETFIFWFSVGTVAIMLTNVLQKRLFVLLAIPLFIASIDNQKIWHKNILAGYSKPSGIVDFVTSNFQHGQCIGFDTFSPKDTSGSQKERRNLYSYYFFNYNIRRMSPEEWLASCDGPFLTFQADAFSKSSKAKVVAKEVSTGLFLVIKATKLDNISIKSLSSSNTGLSIDLTGNDACLIKNCFSMSASSLARFMQVGTYKGDEIVSTTDNGYLFYGPYYPLKKGEYYIKLKGKFIDLEGAVLDIVSMHGKYKHLEIILSEYFKPEEESILIPFSIISDVSDAEIRLHVSSHSKIIFYSYSISLNNGRFVLPDSTVDSSLIYRGKDNIISR